MMKRGKQRGGCACACTCLRRAARAVTQLYDEAFRRMGYRVTQVGVLSALAEMGPVTVSRLAEETVTDRTTLTRNLQLLKKKDLVCLETGKDKRERRVCITPRGERVLRQTQPEWASVQSGVIRRMGRKRFERFMEDLSEVIKAAREGCC